MTRGRYHVFLSYRVFSDKELVGMVYDELVRRTLPDGQGKMRVPNHKDWDKAFGRL